MKKLIITADDYGVFPSINEGVKDAILKGKVNSVACLPNYVDSVKNVKSLLNDVGDMAEIGCHFTISSGEPLTLKGDEAFTFGNYFRPFSELDIDAIERQPEKLINELTAQLQVFLDNGIPVKHLSCHHSTLTTTKPLFEAYLKVADKFGLPMRSVNLTPGNKDGDYRMVLKLMLFDDVPLKKLREMKKFGKEIADFCKTYEKVKMPGILESSHYGPLPFMDIWDATWDKKVAKKHKGIKQFYKEFLEMECSCAELMVHLVNYETYLSGQDDEIKYPGVNQKYFDSRHIEYRSLLGFDFINQHPEVQFGKWSDL